MQESKGSKITLTAIRKVTNVSYVDGSVYTISCSHLYCALTQTAAPVSFCLYIKRTVQIDHSTVHY